MEFPGRTYLEDIDWFVTTDSCGGLYNISIAVDHCIGDSVCWTGWIPVDRHDPPDLPPFDQFKYRVGITMMELCYSPTLHWISFDFCDTLVVQTIATNCLDALPPRIALTCPRDTESIGFGDTVNIFWRSATGSRS